MMNAHTMTKMLALLGVLGTFACSSDSKTVEPPPPAGQPLAPVLEAIASPTNADPITLTGSAQAGATVQARGGAEAIAAATAGADGKFAITVPLHQNADNTLLVSQVVAGVEGPSAAVHVAHDNIAPDNPVIDPVATPTRRISPTLRGAAEAGAQILVTGGAEDRMTTADASGHFEVELALNSAVAAITENHLEVIARDAAGNASGAASIVVVHNPMLPIDAPVMGPMPSFTRERSVTLRGNAEASVAITVAGAAAPATAVAGLDGSFEVEVMLHPNAVNSLSLFAVIAATGISSAPSFVSITQDEIAPDAPLVNPIDSPTGAMTVHLTGQSEALAQIVVSGGARGAVTAAASFDGSFAADVALALDHENVLSLTATDLAGNVSAATGLSIVQDSGLPVPVSVDPVTSPTASNPIVISGTTEANASLEISGGASLATATAGADGRFTASVMLNANARNALEVYRAGGTARTIVVIVHDDVPPEVPVLNPVASPTNQTSLVVSGTAEADARVSISGALSAAMATAGQDGRFAIAVTIRADGRTTMSAIATDRAGNSSGQAVLRVDESSAIPDAPVIDQANPAPTSAASYVITGHVTQPHPDVSVQVSGGAAVASAMTDRHTGAFSVEVVLNSNAVNALHVVSIEGAIVSPEALVSVTADSVAPVAPDGAGISVESPPALISCPARLTLQVSGAMGAVESGARVRITNLASMSAWSTTATANGSFSAGVSACRGEILSITAMDAAGNVSGATEKTVN